MDFQQPDEANEDTLNRILWHSVRGMNAPYPAQQRDERSDDE
jgi:hypothetical protein